MQCARVAVKFGINIKVCRQTTTNETFFVFAML